MSKHGNKKEPTYDEIYESMEQLMAENAALAEERARLQQEVHTSQCRSMCWHGGQYDRCTENYFSSTDRQRISDHGKSKDCRSFEAKL